MGRPLNRFELRAAVEAAEARGIPTTGPKTRRPPGERKESSPRKSPPPAAKTRVVWAVCDIGGRTVTTFDYVQKADAEALIANLKAKGKGEHFLRSIKEPMA